MTLTGVVPNDPSLTAGVKLTNSASIYWDDTGANKPPAIPPANSFAHSGGPATAPLTIVEPAVTIRKAHTGPTTVVPGVGVPFTLTVANPTGTNASTAYRLLVTDTLPQLMDASNVGQGGVVTGTPATGETITWTLASSLAPGASTTLTYTGTLVTGAVGGANYQNTAGVISYSVPATTSGERSYSAEASDSVNVTKPTISKSLVSTVGAPNDDTSQASIGDTVTYTVEVDVPAGVALPNAYVTDQLPAGLITPAPGASSCTLVGGGSCPGFSAAWVTPSGNSLRWNLGGLTGGSSAETVLLVYTAVVADVPGNVGGTSATTLRNSAALNWTGSSVAATPVPVTVVEPRLAVAKAHTGSSVLLPGVAIPYTVTVTNTADAAHNGSAAYDAVVTDAIPAGLVVDPSTISSGGVLGGGGSTITWTLAAPILPGASVALTYDASLAAGVAAGQSFTNDVGATAYSIPSGATDGGRQYTASANDSVAAALPTISKSLRSTVGAPNDDTSQASIGDTVTYTVQVKIPAGLALPSATVTDQLPAGLVDPTPVGSSCTLVGGASCSGFAAAWVAPSGGALQWNLSGLAGGSSDETVALQYSAVVADVPGNVGGPNTTTLVNSASVNWVPPGSNGLTVGPATAPVTVVEPAISITKSHTGPTIVPPGVDVPFTVTVANGSGANTSAAYAGLVTDTVPAGLVVVASTITAGGVLVAGSGSTPSTITWTLSAPLAPGATLSFGYSAHIAAGVPSGATYENTVAFDAASIPGGTLAGGRGYEVTANDEIVQAITSLSLTKQLSSAPLVPGSPATYTIAVTDHGPDPAAGPITVTDTLPTGLTYVSSASTDGFTCGASGQDVTCATDSSVGLPVGDTITLTLTVDVASDVTGDVTNTASATSPTPDLSGNPATATGSTTDTATPVTSLALTKSLVDSPMVAGSHATYTISVTDHGPSDAAGPITVTDTLPTGLTYVSSASADGFTCGASGQDVTCATDSSVGLPVGDTITLTLTVDVGQSLAGSDVTNAATATTPTHDSTGNPATATGSTTDPVGAVTSLSLVKSLSDPPMVAGTPATYSIAVTDHGPSDAAGPITVTDTLPTGLTYVSSASADGFTCGASGQDVTCATDSSVGLPVGDTITLTLTVDVASSVTGDVTNSATATTPTHDSTGNPATATGSTTDTVSTVTSLSLVKSLSDPPMVAGTPATYSIAVTDHGPSDAAGPITVTDTLPTGLSYVSSASSDGFTCSAKGQDVTCATDSSVGLPVGDTIALTLTVDVASSVTGDVTNSATATTPTHDSTGNPATATGSTTDTVSTVTSLRLVKKLESSPMVAGSKATYSIAVTDHGPSDAAGPITVTDTLPTGLTYVSSSSSDGFSCSATGQDVTCATDPSVGLPVGSTISLTLTVSVDQSLAGTDVTNSATATTPTHDSTGNPATATGSTTDPVVAVTSLRS